MIWILMLALSLLGFCLGLSVGADIIRKQVTDGEVVVGEGRYLCYPSTLSAKHQKKH